MNITIYGENLEVTDAIKEHVHKKCQKFNQLIGNSSVEIRLKLDEQKMAISKIDLSHNGENIHINSKDKDMYSSITDLINKTHKVVLQNNDKHYKRKMTA